MSQGKKGLTRFILEPTASLVSPSITVLVLSTNCKNSYTEKLWKSSAHDFLIRKNCQFLQNNFVIFCQLYLHIQIHVVTLFKMFCSDTNILCRCISRREHYSGCLFLFVYQSSTSKFQSTYQPLCD